MKSWSRKAISTAVGMVRGEGRGEIAGLEEEKAVCNMVFGESEGRGWGEESWKCLWEKGRGVWREVGRRVDAETAGIQA